jgi:hypothetical protein
MYHRTAAGNEDQEMALSVNPFLVSVSVLDPSLFFKVEDINMNNQLNLKQNYTLT